MDDGRSMADRYQLESEQSGCQLRHTRRYEEMAIYRELDGRKMRDRDASMGSGDHGNAGDADTLRGNTGDTSGMGGMGGGTQGTSGYGDQDTGMGTGYSSGGKMTGGGQTGSGSTAGSTGDMEPGGTGYGSR